MRYFLLTLLASIGVIQAAEPTLQSFNRLDFVVDTNSPPAAVTNVILINWNPIQFYRAPDGSGVMITNIAGVPGSGSQTPWTSDINGAGYAATNTGRIFVGAGTAALASIVDSGDPSQDSFFSLNSTADGDYWLKRLAIGAFNSTSPTYGSWVELNGATNSSSVQIVDVNATRMSLQPMAISGAPAYVFDTDKAHVIGNLLEVRQNGNSVTNFSVAYNSGWTGTGANVFKDDGTFGPGGTSGASVWTNSAGVITLVDTNNSISVNRYLTNIATGTYWEDHVYGGGSYIGYEHDIYQGDPLEGYNQTFAGFFYNKIPSTNSLDIYQQLGSWGVFGEYDFSNNPGLDATFAGGVYGRAQGAAMTQFGVLGTAAYTGGSSQTNIGIFAAAAGDTVRVGVYAETSGSSTPDTPLFESAVALFDNRDSGIPLIVGRTNNGTHVFEVANDGSITTAGNVSAAGTVTATNGVASVVAGSFSSPVTTNPYSPVASLCYNRTFFYGATGTINLPAGAFGMNIIIYNTGAFTITIDPNGTEAVVRDGNLQAGGVNFTLSAGAGNFVSLVWDGTVWVTVGYKGVLNVGA